MSKSLVIVESPAKAKTINKYLGAEYIVKSSIGHIRDLPVSAKVLQEKEREAPIPQNMAEEDKARIRQQRAYAGLVRTMGIDPEDGWKANYVILPDKRKVLSDLQKLAASAREIILATDLDREGEAIAWHLRESIGGDPAKYKRVTFGEITRPAIQKAFAEPGELNMDRVHAQQTRRFLDRLVGYMISPLLWKKIARGLSAGRVQSVAVRLIVEREREIHSFVPQEYWELFADLKGQSLFRARVVACDGEKFAPKDRQDIDRALPDLRKAIYEVLDRKVTPVTQKPFAPFITSTLQQAASVRLGFSVKKTMTLAQHLYQAGHITYMRTDSRNISSVALQAVRKLIARDYGDRYLPGKPNFYQSGESAQEAHEAIRPTDVDKTPDVLHLEKDEMRLYDLIWRQFVACQMTTAEFDRTTITIKADAYELRASGRVMRFDGWMKVLPSAKTADEETILPTVHVGEKLQLIELDPVQHFTKPPPRYSEASLVKELEKRGIGRPSTYASIISTIQERGYVRLANRRFYAQKIGDIVTDRLLENFQELMDYDFTAGMEKQLDEIARGREQWQEALDKFYAGFKVTMARAHEHMRLNPPVPVTIKCPVCRLPMVARTASTGTFLSCTGYDKPVKERCRATIPLTPADESVAVSANDEEGSAEEILAKKRCLICGTAMDSWFIDEKRRLHICGNSPDCRGALIEQGDFRMKGYDGPIIQCEKCGSDMQLKSGRFGKYFACTGQECKSTRKLMRNGQPAPPMAAPVPMPELKCEKSAAHFLLREGLAGLFLAAHTFPKSRETRSPLVEDLARHRHELDAKFYYLADAPQTDPDGNKAVIKWKRKERYQYLGSIRDGQATKWTAEYNDGVWEWKKSKV
ncbi:type I DNA topoisomerase [candidate division KSB1 bacterium]|nr:type I DNA topoisomerase [candidate division KSB1 bacterium]